MNETLNTVHRLSTTRAANFSSQQVSESDLQTIIEASVRAANASGRQSYSIIVVDQGIKDKLQWPGSRVLLFCVDFCRLVDTAEYLDLEFDAGYLMQFITGVVDTSLAVQTAVIAAKSLGIASLITNRVYHQDLGKVYDLLNLPEEYCFPLVLLCLGYPKVEPGYVKGRLAGSGVVHYGQYQRLTPAEIEELLVLYDDPANHLGLMDIWQKQNFDHYLQWFFAKWSRRVGSRDSAAEFNATLKSLGFLGDISP